MSSWRKAHPLLPAICCTDACYKACSQVPGPRRRCGCAPCTSYKSMQDPRQTGWQSGGTSSPALTAVCAGDHACLPPIYSVVPGRRCDLCMQMLQSIPRPSTASFPLLRSLSRPERRLINGVGWWCCGAQLTPCRPTKSTRWTCNTSCFRHPQPSHHTTSTTNQRIPSTPTIFTS